MLLNKSDVNNDFFLTSRLREGDEKAFYDIYVKYHKQLYFVALKYLKSEILSEDALQDVFLKLWVNRDRLNEQLPVKGFLFTSLKNHVLNILRNRRVEILKKAALQPGETFNDNETENELILHEYTEIVDSGIKKLSPQKQIIFKLRTFQGLTNDEVASQLGISINTVKFQFSQASKFLRDYLKQHSNI